MVGAMQTLLGAPLVLLPTTCHGVFLSESPMGLLGPIQTLLGSPLLSLLPTAAHGVSLSESTKGLLSKLGLKRRNKKVRESFACGAVVLSLKDSLFRFTNRRESA